jgi:peptide deformylase
MALRYILTEEDPALRKTSRPVVKFDDRLHQLIDDMIETLKDSGGVGLAAPQVGVLRCVVLVENEEGQILELVNPEILETSGEQDGMEGCLSLPGKWGLVKRPNYVKLKAQDRYGNWFETEGYELTARAFCHETDHLVGRLYTDVTYKMLAEEEVEAYYADMDTGEE